MKTSRITIFAICLALALVLPTGTVLGQALVTASRNFSFLVADAGTALTIADALYTIGVQRAPGSGIFVLEFKLANGTFSATPADPTITGGGAAAISFRDGGIGTNAVTYNVADPTVTLEAGIDFFTLDNATVEFDNNVLGAEIDMTVRLNDLFGDFDTVPVADKTGEVAELAETVTLEAPGDAIAGAPPVDSATVIDAIGATPPRTLFTGAGNDTTEIAFVPVTITNTVVGVFAPDGVTDYILLVGDVVTVNLTGNFEGADVDGVFFDLDGGLDNDGGAELFTVPTGGGIVTATIAVPGTSLPGGGPPLQIGFENTTATVMEPRNFTITLDVTAAVGSTQNRTGVIGVNSPFWVWGQNGTTFKSPFFSLFATVEGKFACQNTSSLPVTVIPTILFYGDGAATLSTTGDFGASDSSFVVPANGGILVETVQTGNPISGSVGPLIVPGSLTGTVPIRASAELIALTATTNISCRTLTPSALGIIIFDPMDRTPALP